LITAGWLWSTQTGNKKDMAGKNSIAVPPVVNPQDNGNSSATNQEDASSSNTPGDQQVFAENKTNGRRSQGAGDNRVLKYASVVTYPAYKEYPITISSTPIHEENNTVMGNLDVPVMTGDYLLIAAPDGQFTRMSSKFANAIRYLHEDDADEESNQLSAEGQVWKKRFQEWRKKIIQSAFIPSSGNFFDIADLKELLEEK
jgi:hypothetical protein